MTQMVAKGCQNDARAAKLKPQGCPKGAQMAPRVTLGASVLAEGCVDPAAGSRDEPTRLHVEAPVAARKQV